jgi:5-methylcytosine-specific restriction enzyme A
MSRKKDRHESKQPRVSRESFETCVLCERKVRSVTYHHLVPKSRGGTETVPLCSPCHATLHKFFTNQTLARELHTIEALRANEDIARYLAWIRKQPDRRIRVRESKNRR